MTTYYLGLDLETSGTTHEDHVPIQIGTAVRGPTGDFSWFRRNIGRWPWRDYPKGGRWLWDPEAAQVHGLSRTVIDQAEASPTVDGLVTAWRKTTLKGVKRFDIVPVGWNVAGFDRPFINRHLPHFSDSIGYRSIDLNAVVFYLTLIGLKRKTGPRWTYRDLKRFVQESAAERVNMLYPDIGGGLHDAAWDAAAAVFALEELTRLGADLTGMVQ